MIPLLSVLIFKSLCGLRQYLGYKNLSLGLITAFIGLGVIYLAFPYGLFSNRLFLGKGLVLLSGVGTVMVYNAFESRKKGGKGDIHLWALIESWGVPWGLFLLGSPALAILTGVALGEVVFKGLVNRATGRPFIDANEITDQADGDSFSIPTFGIKIPRISNGYVSLAISLGLLALYLLNDLYLSWEIKAFGLDLL
jgi:uncharacterized membrane protein (UPF0136 family)